MWRWLAACSLLASCGHDVARPRAIRFLHTFAPDETELFNALMIERGLAVDPSLVPFARGQQVIREILVAGKDCPDLVRIDATWLPGLVAAQLLVPVPPALGELDWTPEAAALVRGSPQLAIPETVDGLFVIRDESRPAPASPAIDALVAAARATRTPTTQYPLGVRVDGYWFVPWLRAEGGELATGSDNSSAGPGAARALGKFAGLFGDVAPPPPPAGSEAPDELRRWQNHEMAYWITGPWQVGALGERDRLQVSALAHAPRGGQLLVVPRCAKHPDDGWRLARELTDVAVAHRFAESFATIPSRTTALQASPALVRAMYAALATAEPLPRTPETPLLFDDLNPALAAAIAHDATPEEAIAGVRHGWQRLAKQEHP
jgi:hypothetical protein